MIYDIDDDRTIIVRSIGDRDRVTQPVRRISADDSSIDIMQNAVCSLADGVIRIDRYVLIFKKFVWGVLARIFPMRSFLGDPL